MMPLLSIRSDRLQSEIMAAVHKYDQADIYNLQTAHPDEAHSILMRLVPPGSRVLEVGCATGYLSGYMTQTLGCQVTGLELNPAAAAVAATRCHAAYAVDLDSPAALNPARSDRLMMSCWRRRSWNT